MNDFYDATRAQHREVNNSVIRALGPNLDVLWGYSCVDKTVGS
jgi:hypothetical protein